MKTINLTAPLSPFFPIGSVFPWDAAFRTEEIASYERNAARLFYISMGSDSGTRLMGPGLVSPDAPKIQSLSLDRLVNRVTRVVQIPKAAGEAIEAKEVKSALSKLTDLANGEAILIATGWGDGQKWKTVGEKYALESPYFTPKATEVILSVLEKNQSDLLLTDCAYLDRLGSPNVRAEWASLSPWLRPPWPSDQAQAYLRHYTAEMVKADWPVTLRVLEKTWAVAGLVNCGQLPSRRIRLTCLPMFVQDAGEAPCTVIAEI
jgi:kynurenine formamidase